MKNNSGFTLVELLVVLAVIGILFTMVVPNMSKISYQFRKKGLQSKINMIENAATLYSESNTNKIKNHLFAKIGNCDSEVNGKCINEKKCSAYGNEGECGSYQDDFKYICYITIKDLIDNNYYKSNDSETCSVLKNTSLNNSDCMDNYKITIVLDADYKGSYSVLKDNGTTDAKFHCTN